MALYKSMKEFIEKVDWEGDIMSAIMFGVTEYDIPEDDTDRGRRLFQLWEEATTFQPTLDEIQSILDEYAEEEEEDAEDVVLPS
jgi:hypothetical protein